MPGEEHSSYASRPPGGATGGRDSFAAAFSPFAHSCSSAQRTPRHRPPPPSHTDLSNLLRELLNSVTPTTFSSMSHRLRLRCTRRASKELYFHHFFPSVRVRQMIKIINIRQRARQGLAHLGFFARRAQTLDLDDSPMISLKNPPFFVSTWVFFKP